MAPLAKVLILLSLSHAFADRNATNTCLNDETSLLQDAASLLQMSVTTAQRSEEAVIVKDKVVEEHVEISSVFGDELDVNSIPHGEKINAVDYKFMVVFRIIDMSIKSAAGSNMVNQAKAYRCSGTFIGPQWVLTARHCFQDGEETGTMFRDLVRDNLIAAFDFVTGQPRLTKIASILYPGGDLAVVKLEAAVGTADNTVRLGTLAHYNQIPVSENDPTFIAYGFGRWETKGGVDERFNTPLSKTLSSTNLAKVDPQMCGRMIGDLPNAPEDWGGKGRTPDEIVCTMPTVGVEEESYKKVKGKLTLVKHDKSYRNAANPSSGDSGGPLIDLDGHGNSLQFGTLIGGMLTDGMPVPPRVYMNVPQYRVRICAACEACVACA